MVYKIKKSIPSKIIYFAFILLMSFMFVIGFPCVQAMAFPPLILAGVAIAPEVVAAGIALMVAAGIVYYSYTDAETAFKHMYLSASPQLRANLAFLGAGVNLVTDYVWGGVNSHVNKNFSANDVNKSVVVHYGEHAFGSTTLPYTTDINTPVIISKNTFTFPADFSTSYSLGSEAASKHVLSAGTVVYPIFSNNKITLYTNGSKIQFYDDSNGYLFQYFKYLCDVNFYIWRGDDGFYWLCMNGISSSGAALNTKVCKMEPVTDALNKESYSASASSAVSPTNDYKNANGTRNLNVPADPSSLVGKTAADVQTYAEPTTSNPTTTTPTDTAAYHNTWSGAFKDCTANMTTSYTFAGSGTITGDMDYSKTGTWAGTWAWTSSGARQWNGTFTDASGNTWTGTATEVSTPSNTATEMPENTKTWWSEKLCLLLGPINTLLSGIKNGVTGVLEWLQAFWQKLLEALSSALNPVITAVLSAVAAITGIKTAVEAQDIDLTQTTKNYNLPDLFVLVLKVILACIRLVLRCSVYLATIIAISPDSSLLNEYTVSGIDFFKNQTIPNLNVSVWTLFSSLITVLFGLAVIKRIRQMYSV